MERNESIVTKGFLVKSNLMLTHFPRWFMILTLGFCGFIKETLWIVQFISSVSRPRDFETIRFTIYNVVFLSRCVIATFTLDWKAFAAYIEQLSRVELEKDDESVKRINRERRVKKWFCFVALLSYIILNIIHFVTLLRKESYTVSILIVDIVLFISHFFLIYLIIDLCICLKVAFQYINHHLKHFQITSPNLMLSELRHIRSMYSCTVRASQEAEKFARHFIAWFYCQFILFNIANIVDLLGQRNEKSIIFFLFMVVDGINTGYLTMKLVAVNKASTSGMEDLYEISYDLKSYNLQNENNLFLNRMLWQNVGFTFSDLFLINPSFITSLLSFVLSIALMIANFLYH
ncbi:uncharacterized protein LOC112538808 [Tetranychus urticae]|uniref:Gustatory receptor n=1 Tax=Tetranychus urticae TaxID=32264 RepID=T1K9I1_TETUR|nr:uncharacterized protein LOC112538808 [Tetranychus urticae]